MVGIAEAAFLIFQPAVALRSHAKKENDQIVLIRPSTVGGLAAGKNPCPRSPEVQS